jgi:hypothetical protein
LAGGGIADDLAVVAPHEAGHPLEVLFDTLGPGDLGAK